MTAFQEKPALNLDETVLGIEFGSTRIKAVLLNHSHTPVAGGSFQWENHLVDGLWTYDAQEIEAGLQACFADLSADVERTFSQKLTHVGAIGVSGMMHGYLPFDKEGRQLVPFRTWRNTTTGPAAQVLSRLFSFNIPQRWSVAHLYQAILNEEEHVERLDFLTTLAGYIHWRLTGEKVLGVGEASGMFPIDSANLDYDPVMLEKFEQLVEDRNYPWHIAQLLPKVLPAGALGGALTEEGARFLDPSGTLRPGIPCAPPEGDAGTGMTATHSVRAHTGNISAGTSAFAMLVSDRPLGVYREIDMVTTPAGLPVAMVHCNNCTSDINAWVELFFQFAQAIGSPITRDELFPLLFNCALKGEADGGGLLSFNYISGEGVTDVDDGRPILLRAPGSRFTLENVMRTHLMSSLVTLKLGLDILTAREHLPVSRVYAHGGLFKTPQVGQRILSAAIGSPVSVMETAGEGGPYGMALLCAYMLWREDGETLEDYLDDQVFAQVKTQSLTASPEEIAGFEAFAQRWRSAFLVERTAVETV